MAFWNHHAISHVTVRTSALQKSNLIRAPLWLPKKTDNAKRRTADARAKRFWVYRF